MQAPNLKYPTAKKIIRYGVIIPELKHPKAVKTENHAPKFTNSVSNTVFIRISTQRRQTFYKNVNIVQ